jgi:hypothetical protein
VCAANKNRFIIDHRLLRQNVRLFLREPLEARSQEQECVETGGFCGLGELLPRTFLFYAILMRSPAAR